ncbi:MAG: hypothetical protein IJT13_01450 [Bacteroidaceae bacterium]|nr:hypothetical protein [Bacteroidaceae bacterium]
MTTAKAIILVLGGIVGWLVELFHPAFPLAVVMIMFILYDAWTAYQLDKRAKVMFPDRTKRHEAKFSSFCFGKVVRKTIPERLAVIILAFVAEKFVFVHVDWPLSYIATGVICFEQAWSTLENNAACRTERESRFWRMLQRIVIDKTERHLDITLDELRIPNQVTEEQISQMRDAIQAHERAKEAQEI